MSDNQLDDGGAAFPADIQRRNPMTGEWLEPPPQGMTLRAYAAIKLRVPESGIDWLDAMIVKAKRDEFAGMAMQGEIANGRYMGRLAANAYAQADAMLAERKRGAE